MPCLTLPPEIIYNTKILYLFYRIIINDINWIVHWQFYQKITLLQTYKSMIISSKKKKAALLNLLNKFVKDRNFFLSQHGLTMRFPRHIWYTQGQMGRKVKCTIRGCYLGDFVKSYAYSSEKLPLWRYVLSFGGIVLMLIAAYIFHRKTSSCK